MSKIKKDFSFLEKNPFTRTIKITYIILLIIVVLGIVAFGLEASYKASDEYRNCQSLLKTKDLPKFRGFRSSDENTVPTKYNWDKLKEGQEETLTQDEKFESLLLEGYSENEVIEYLNCQAENESIYYYTNVPSLILIITVSLALLWIIHTAISKIFLYIVKGKT